MSNLDSILRARQLLPTSFERWERFRAAPAAFMDGFLAGVNFRSPTGDWDLFETIFDESCFTILGGANNEFFLSMMLNGEVGRIVQCDFGEGQFIRSSQPGAFILGHDARLHTLQGIGPFHTMMIWMRQSAVQHRIESITQRKMPSLDVLHSKEFRDDGLEILMRKLLALIHHQERNTFLSKLEDQFDTILLRLLTVAKIKTTPIVDTDKIDSQKIRQVIDLIHSRLGSNISRDELALAAGVSPCHFSRLFQQSTGTTATDYVSKLRIDRAKELLRSPEPLSLAKISESLGFSNQSHFGREFRRFTGMTPRQFRGSA